MNGTLFFDEILTSYVFYYTKYKKYSNFSKITFGKKIPGFFGFFRNLPDFNNILMVTWPTYNKFGIEWKRKKNATRIYAWLSCGPFTFWTRFGKNNYIEKCGFFTVFGYNSEKEHNFLMKIAENEYNYKPDMKLNTTFSNFDHYRFSGISGNFPGKKFLKYFFCNNNSQKVIFIGFL